MACRDRLTPSDEAQSNKSETVSRPESSSKSWFVRPMRQEDIDKCLEIWLQVELTEAHVTVANALTCDPAGFYVAELRANGEVIGMCSGVMASPATAFMGFYAVTPEYQGIGVGRELWARTVARLYRSNTNIGLYGVPNMSEKYKKSGFKIEDEIRMIIFESEPGVAVKTDLLKCVEDVIKESATKDGAIKLLSGQHLCNEEMIQLLIEYDQKIHGHSRQEVLRNYLLEAKELPLTVALVQQSAAGVGKKEDVERKLSCCLSKTSQENDLVAGVKSSLSITTFAHQNNEQSKSQQDGQQTIRVLGYGCIRHDNTGGCIIGPLYSDSSDAAEVILRVLIENCGIKAGGKYSVMSLTSNKQAEEPLTRIGFQEMDQCSRMFTHFIPEAQLEKIHYVHSPNFSLF